LQERKRYVTKVNFPPMMVLRWDMLGGPGLGFGLVVVVEVAALSEEHLPKGDE
jgi:hypothetical protein